MIEPYEEICYLCTRSDIRFRVTREWYSLRPVRKYLVSKSGRSEFIFRLVPCKRMKKMYGDQYELIPV